MKFPKLQTRLFDLVCKSCKSNNIFLSAGRGATQCRECGTWTTLNATDWEILPKLSVVNLAIFELIGKNAELGKRLKEKFFYSEDKTNTEKYACYFNIYTYLTEPPVYQLPREKKIPEGNARPPGGLPKTASKHSGSNKRKTGNKSPEQKAKTGSPTVKNETLNLFN